ncbi:MAG: 3-isopropylmalate dehydratase [Desulfurococcaceae archaeon]
MIVRGRCWKFGDDVSTDHIISGKYKFGAIDDIRKMLPHVFEELVPGFHEKVRPGDVIVAGRNFGKGSSREQAPRLLKMLGIGAVIARSFSHIFFRNAINVGLPVVVARELPRIAEQGDLMVVDLAAGVVVDETKGFSERFPPYPGFALEVLSEGGMVEYVRRRGVPPWRAGRG